MSFMWLEFYVIYVNIVTYNETFNVIWYKILWRLRAPVRQGRHAFLYEIYGMFSLLFNDCDS